MSRLDPRSPPLPPHTPSMVSISPAMCTCSSKSVAADTGAPGLRSDQVPPARLRGAAGQCRTVRLLCVRNSFRLSNSCSRRSQATVLITLASFCSGLAAAVDVIFRDKWRGSSELLRGDAREHVGWWSSERPVDESLARQGDHLGRDSGKIVDRHDAFDLGKQPLDQTKVATRDARDRVDHGSVGVLVQRRVQAELHPLVLDHPLQFWPLKGRNWWTKPTREYSCA